MELLCNLSQNFILIKDFSKLIDFNLIDSEWSELSWEKNINNFISQEMNFFDKDVFVDAKRNILDECKKYLNGAFALQDYYTDLKMTRSWGNITKPGQMHHDHKHPFSVVSGVLFLDNNPSNLNLYIESYLPEIPYFIGRNMNYSSLKHLIADMNVKQEEHNNLEKHLILFLSNKSHFVEADMDNQTDRRSISFNTFWEGHTGVKTSALGSLIY